MKKILLMCLLITIINCNYFAKNFGGVIKNSLYKEVYASFNGYSFERALLLDRIVKL
jgi:hypothetical protein